MTLPNQKQLQTWACKNIQIVNNPKLAIIIDRTLANGEQMEMPVDNVIAE